MQLTDAKDLKQVYEYQTAFNVPYFIDTDFESWKESFENDVDGEGKQLFRELHSKIALDGGIMVGFVQYGHTAFGFDGAASYPVIRALYFDEDRADAGRLLLETALAELGDQETVYAFFHYFGMSCFARHGKLYERFDWIHSMLMGYGFEIEHENVYYSARLIKAAASGVALKAQTPTPGGQQTFDFFLSGSQVGCCEIHDVDGGKTAYLRWIWINDDVQNRGIGSRCMTALKQYLYEKGFTRLDTDTAVLNPRAQHYYEKNGFTREGITRSFLRRKA